MPAYRIPKRFKKRLDKKIPQMRGAIYRCIAKLADDPRHPGLHTHKVQGSPGVIEAYIDAGNRLTFEWDGDTIVLRNHCNHDILKDP